MKEREIKMSLTEEKSAFAAANHGLVHSFLKERELPEDEYYDTVIFAFLDCVIKNTDGDFKARAYAAMAKAADDSSAEWEPHTVSFSDTPDFIRTVEETLADGRDNISELLERIRMKQLLAFFEKNERETVALLLEGFTPAEISFRLKKSCTELEGIMNNIRAKAAAILPAA